MSCLVRKHNLGENVLILEAFGVLDEQLPSYPIVYKLKSIPQLKLTMVGGKHRLLMGKSLCYLQVPPRAR